MGCGGSKSSDQDKISREIEAAQKKEAKADSEKVKLLLLGAGESGKSTIFKQMKVLFGKPMSEEERLLFVTVVHSNIMQVMKTLVEQVDIFGYKEHCENPKEFEMIASAADDVVIVGDLANAIKTLFQDKAVLMTWDRRNEFQVVESTKPFITDIDRTGAEGFIPTPQDILLCRVRTSGIVEEEYIIDDVPFVMYDVGGQRNERKKWIHCFENVTAVIFVAAISEYDQQLYEMAEVNRMTEAIQLFDDICNNQFFTESSMILFLNKRDLFEMKIVKKSISDVPDFADYDGKDKDYDDGCKYFLNKFLNVNKNPESKQIYHHITCATDTNNVNVVFNSCKEIILRGNLTGSGFMA